MQPAWHWLRKKEQDLCFWSGNVHSKVKKQDKKVISYDPVSVKKIKLKKDAPV